MNYKYAVIIEKGKTSYGAYAPDLPGCVAVGDSPKEVQRLIEEAIEFHLEGLMLDGEPVPKATTRCGYVDIDLARVKKAIRQETRASAANGSPRPRSKKK